MSQRLRLLAPTLCPGFVVDNPPLQPISLDLGQASDRDDCHFVGLSTPRIAASTLSDEAGGQRADGRRRVDVSHGSLAVRRPCPSPGPRLQRWCVGCSACCGGQRAEALNIRAQSMSSESTPTEGQMQRRESCSAWRGRIWLRSPGFIETRSLRGSEVSPPLGEHSTSPAKSAPHNGTASSPADNSSTLIANDLAANKTVGSANRVRTVLAKLFTYLWSRRDVQGA